MTTATLTVSVEIEKLYDEYVVDLENQDEDFYAEAVKFSFLDLCYWRLSYPDVETVIIDDSHIIFRGEETLVTVFEPHTLDGFYLVLTKQDGSLEVKFFPYEITALEAATLVAHYGGCPCDKEEYLEAVQYDLGVSYSLESWDSKE